MSFLKEQLPPLKDFMSGKLPKTLRFSLLFFIFSVSFGAVLYLTDPDTTNAILDEFSKAVADAGVIDETTGTISVFALLQNNWMAMLTTVVLGFLPFLLLPALSLFSNSVLLGILAAMYCTTDSLSLGLFLAGILPHGIFEIPALILSSACGILLCVNASRFVLKRSSFPMVPLIGDLLRVLLFVVAPLTVGAAVIECYVTPVVMAMFA